MLVRELDLHPGQNRLDARRLEVVVDGLELFNGAQLAVDTTLVLGTPRRRDRLSEGSNSGWRSPQKSQSKEGENPSITRWRGGGARLVVLAAEVGWTSVKRSFPVRAFFGVGQSAECSGVHPKPSGTRMESEMEETFGMHSCEVVREHVAGARVANRCRRHNTLRG